MPLTSLRLDVDLKLRITQSLPSFDAARSVRELRVAAVASTLLAEGTGTGIDRIAAPVNSAKRPPCARWPRKRDCSSRMPTPREGSTTW